MTENRKKYMDKIGESEKIVRELIKRNRFYIIAQKEKIQRLKNKDNHELLIKLEIETSKRAIKTSKLTISALKKELMKMTSHSYAIYKDECANSIQFKDIVSCILNFLKR